MGISVPWGAGSQRRVQRLSLAVLSRLGESEGRRRPSGNRAQVGVLNRDLFGVPTGSYFGWISALESILHQGVGTRRRGK